MAIEEPFPMINLAGHKHSLPSSIELKDIFTPSPHPCTYIYGPHVQNLYIYTFVTRGCVLYSNALTNLFKFFLIQKHNYINYT
jgi:hypothetical protein